MCPRSEAMREVREAACTLSAACLGIDTAQLRDPRTLRLLPKAPPDFAELLDRIR